MRCDNHIPFSARDSDVQKGSLALEALLPVGLITGLLERPAVRHDPFAHACYDDAVKLKALRTVHGGHPNARLRPVFCFMWPDRVGVKACRAEGAPVVVEQ